MDRHTIMCEICLLKVACHQPLSNKAVFTVNRKQTSEMACKYLEIFRWCVPSWQGKDIILEAANNAIHLRLVNNIKGCWVKNGHFFVKSGESFYFYHLLEVFINYTFMTQIQGNRKEKYLYVNNEVRKCPVTKEIFSEHIKYN